MQRVKIIFKTSFFVNFLVGILFFTLNLIYFHKMIWGFVPIPLDIMVGGYYPWLDYKWGYDVGVPVKNPVLSDIYSTLYIWRFFAIDIFRIGEVPLWNPYTFAGMPLLANWQSAVFYPLNILMILFGNLWGWSLMIALQPLLSMTFMYLFLREIKLDRLPSIFGSIIFSFSGFMMTYLEYGTLGQSFMWLPLLLFLTDRGLKRNNWKYFILLPFVIFTVITAGSFQGAFYVFFVVAGYVVIKIYELYRSKELALNFLNLIFLIMFFTAGIGLSAIQLFPTFELFNLSIRDVDNNIVYYRYGLLPLINIVTFFAPDFFGNNGTLNFWGFMGYQETSGYFGILSIGLILVAIYRSVKERNSMFIYFSLVFILSFILVFDTFLGNLIYQFKMPILSTSYATRMLLLTGFAAAVLGAWGMHILNEHRVFLFRWTLFLALFLLILLSFVKFLTVNPGYLLYFNLSADQLNIAFRNIILPILLVSFFLIVLKVVKGRNLLFIAIVCLSIFDLFRYGWKFNAFSEVQFNFPTTPVIDYLKVHSNNYRIEREKSEVLPPNTMLGYKLQTPSGYDPLLLKEYGYFYSIYDNHLPGDGFSRYLEMTNYESSIADLLGVKYFVVAKRDDQDKIKIDGTASRKFLDSKFVKVFEDKSVVVFENTSVLNRAFIVNNFEVIENISDTVDALYRGYPFKEKAIIDKNLNSEMSSTNNNCVEGRCNSFVQIVNYSENHIDLEIQNIKDGLLVLTDQFYPGWRVFVDGKERDVLKVFGIFRGVEVKAGEKEIKFIYVPKSFQVGVIISSFSLVFILIMCIIRFMLDNRYFMGAPRR